MLYGREAERAQLAALVTSARVGNAAVLAVVGDPGAGKSALLADLVANVQSDPQQPAFRILTTTGVASEAPLPFAALHRLLRPVLAWDRLPAPQARALRVAFGQEDGGGDPVEPFLVGVATLSVLTEATEPGPVLCVVDDAHWLDQASADALLFAARQLQADHVAVVFGARQGDGGAGSFAPDSLPVLTLAGLDPEAARNLLAQRAGVAPADEVVTRLLTESGGNPLALLELPTELRADQLSGAAPLPARMALTARVERAFLDRIRRSSAEVQTLMLIAAADDTGRFGVIRDAARALGADTAAWDDAERFRLLTVTDARVTVRHPLVQSAVYQAATSLERRHAHAALAGALTDDPDRQVWHRAAASGGPDAAVADALHEVAQRAQRQGAYPAAADAFERAAALTVTAPQRGERLFAAARNAWTAGQSTRAKALCGAAGALAEGSLLRADIDRLRGRIEMNVGSAVDAHRIFTEAASQVSGRDPVRAVEMAVAAAVAQSHGVDSGARLADTTIDVAPSPADTPRTRCLKQLLVSTRHDIAGERGAALATLRGAVETALSAPDSSADLDLLGNLGNAALHLGDDDLHRQLYALMLSTARQRGDGMAVLYALQRLSFGQYVGGDWAALRRSSEEAVALGGSVGQRGLTAAPAAWLTLLAALQGHADYDDRLAALGALVAAHPLVGILAQPVEDLTRWARGVRTALGGSAPDALHHFRQLRRPTLTLMAIQECLDAAVRAGDLTQAGVWEQQLDAFAAGTREPWVQAAATFGRALALAHEEAADVDTVCAQFEASLRHHAAANRPFDRARVQLAYGQFLRRTQRRVEARGHLREALATFEDLQAAPFADRAAEELRATGETARKRDPSTLLTLTPMERKIAELVRQGLSNKDVAAQCWVSPRTVAFHLRNVFAKLAITSRGELARLDLG